MMDLFASLIHTNVLYNLLCVVGLWALSCWCYENFKSLFQIIFNVLTPFFMPHENKSLVEQYGKWAGRKLFLIKFNIHDF